jgi:hypothetical protein
MRLGEPEHHGFLPRICIFFGQLNEKDHLAAPLVPPLRFVRQEKAPRPESLSPAVPCLATPQSPIFSLWLCAVASLREPFLPQESAPCQPTLP